MIGQDEFLAQPCFCGHTRAEHRVSVTTGRCRVCPDRHFFDKPEHHERRLREQAVRDDPSHRHERTHTVYACPGFVARQLCDDCGVLVEADHALAVPSDAPEKP